MNDGRSRLRYPVNLRSRDLISPRLGLFVMQIKRHVSTKQYKGILCETCPIFRTLVPFLRAGKETKFLARDPSEERQKQRGAESPQRSPGYRANWRHRLTKGRC